MVAGAWSLEHGRWSMEHLMTEFSASRPRVSVLGGGRGGQVLIWTNFLWWWVDFNFGQNC